MGTSRSQVEETSSSATSVNVRWRHVVEGHAEMARYRGRVLSILSSPERVLPGRRPGEEWFYGRGGPSAWIKVVVHWTNDRGTVVTAFARRRLP